MIRMRPCVWKDSSGKELRGNGIVIRSMPSGCKKSQCDGLQTEHIMKECGLYVPNLEHAGRCHNGD